jgi:hypothetical protein
VTWTLEKELDAAVRAQGYFVRFADTTYFHVYLYRDGKQIDGKLYARWFWHRRRAARWVRRTIREHERMLARMGVTVR